MGNRLSTTKPYTCVTCEIEITGPPTFHVGLPFCCSGCVANGPCTCSYDRPVGDPGIRHCHDIEGIVDDRPADRQPARDRVAVGAR